MPENTSEAVSWQWDSPGVLLVDLHSAPANALGTALITGLDAALDAALAPDAGTKVIVISSSIAGFFAAGADIKLMASIDFAGFESYGDQLRAVVDRLANAPVLAIAAVEGLALGGGLELTLACTLRVAGGEAQFGLPEVKLGLIPGAGGTQRLPRLVGRGRALDIMLTGRQVSAADAHSIGLVDRLAVAGQALTDALALAKTLTRASAPAQAAVVRTVDAAFDLPLAEGNAFERAQIAELFQHGEGQEGIAAFVEKRRPDFS
ncbi:MAG: echA [Subtercola sp.]|nr:echA [Subtercola sp.]